MMKRTGPWENDDDRWMASNISVCIMYDDGVQFISKGKSDQSKKSKNSESESMCHAALEPKQEKN